MERYRTISENEIFTGEIVEKKSRFIGCLSYVSSEKEAMDFLSSVKKKHYDARHNCSAYIIAGTGQDILHSSDDGEPSGTAGKPIMTVLQGKGLKNVILVVTRYFGGTLLGTGGLVRAYTDAAKAAVSTAEKSIITMDEFMALSLTFGYAKEGTVRRFLEKYGIYPKDTAYSDEVTFTVNIPADMLPSFDKEIREALAGSLRSEEMGLIMLPVK